MSAVASSSAPAPGAGTPPQPPAGVDAEVFFSRTTGKWTYETADGEHEYDTARRQWLEVVGEDIIRRQQAAYSVAGVDENAPAFEPRDKKAKKRARRAANGEDPDEPAQPKKPSSRNTAIFISNLPDNPEATVDELAETFSRAGLILEGVDGMPKIKLYSGESRGKALVVYFKEESVSLALTLFDGAPLRIGGTGHLRVEKASFEHKPKGDENGNAEAGPSTSKKPKLDPTKAKQGKKAEKLRSRLENWSSEDEDAPKKAPVASKNARVAVLAHMFTLAELESDPTLLLDLKEDVRSECEETCGKVTSVVLYDLEPTGVMTVKFADPVAAKACVLKMNGRFFGGRQVIAGIYDGKHRYRKSGRGVHDDDAEMSEQQRLEEFSQWLEAEEGAS